VPPGKKAPAATRWPFLRCGPRPFTTSFSVAITAAGNHQFRARRGAVAFCAISVGVTRPRSFSASSA